MPPNPNPSLITDEMWSLWEQSAAVIPGVKLGGIWAAKRGYHSSVNLNKANWPADYSIRFAPDLKGQFNKARAIDLTMSNAEMMKRTGYLVAAVKANDPRLRCLREFIGTLDTKNVTCYIKDSEGGAWRFDSGRDTSHLWHIHISIFTSHVDIQANINAVVSVLKGEALSEGDDMFCKYGDKGDKVTAMQLAGQRAAKKMGITVLPVYGADGGYGNETVQMLLTLLPADIAGDGKTYGPRQYDALMALAYEGAQGPKGDPGKDGADGVGLTTGVTIGGPFTIEWIVAPSEPTE